MKPRKYTPPSMFLKSEPSNISIMSPAEYLALLKAARDKGKMEAFYKWQRNRKIILKGLANEPAI